MLGHSSRVYEEVALNKTLLTNIADIHTYIPLTLYPRRGSRDISDTPPRHFTKMIQH
jgi:hypothetical protein